MGTLLLALTFLVIIIAVLTGFAKLATRDNQVLKVLHRSCGPLSNFLYGLYFILFQFQISVPSQRIAMALAFILLVYTGLVSPKSELSGKNKTTHITLAILSFVMFSFIVFSLFLV